MDAQTTLVEFHRGTASVLMQRPIEGPDLSIRGPEGEWVRLASGSIPFVQAINILHGKLAVSGDLLAAAWANPALSEFFRVAGRTRQQ